MLRKIVDFVKKILWTEPMVSTVNTLKDAMRDLEVARNHFENCDPEFITDVNSFVVHQFFCFIKCFLFIMIAITHFKLSLTEIAEICRAVESCHTAHLLAASRRLSAAFSSKIAAVIMDILVSVFLQDLKGWISVTNNTWEKIGHMLGHILAATLVICAKGLPSA